MNSLKKTFGIWLLLLIGMNVVNWHDGGLNAASRFAAIQSMAEDHSFRIDYYKSWSDDWAQGPSGGIYSNKAPGPMLIAAPVAWILNRIKVFTYGKDAWYTYPDGTTKLTKPDVGYDTLISWIFQLIPFCLITFWALKWLRRAGGSYAALNFTCLALLFGNTCAIFLNMYFGHPVAGWALLAALLCLYRREYVFTGLLFGFSVLSDYGTVFVALPFLVSVFLFKYRDGAKSLNEKTLSQGDVTTFWTALWKVALGGIAPAIVFAWYHAACFGKPWALPMQFQNPMFVETGVTRPTLWGVAAPIPDWDIFLRLCFGTQRGILFTQPWMIVSVFAIGWMAWKKKLSRDLVAGLVFSFGGLLGLLWMNAGFNGWHGGATAGPRYLSIIFPCVGLMTGLMYDRLSLPFQKALWWTLGYSLLFRIVIYCTSPTPDWPVPLWTYSMNYFFSERHLAVRVVTFLLTCGCFGWAGYSAWKQRKQNLAT